MNVEPFLRCEKDGPLLTVLMNRPESRNAIGTHQDCLELVDAFNGARDDPAVSCIILTGSGTAFCAGGNLKVMKERSGIGPRDTPEATRANYRRGVQRVIEAAWNCEVPMIAAVNGHTLGLGLDLACLCDMRIASESAKFSSSFIKIGLVPGDGGAWILPRTVGLAKAAELILTGDAIDARTALDIGLVSKLVTPGELMAEARRLAERVVVNPPKVLRLAKRLLREGQQQRLSDALELSAAFQALAHETNDHAEAIDAFLAKRPPRFRGK